MKNLIMTSVFLFSLNGLANKAIYCEANVSKSSSEQPKAITLDSRNIRKGSVFSAEEDGFKFTVHLGFPSADNLTYKIESTAGENINLVSRHSASQIGEAVTRGYDHGKPSLQVTLPDSNTSVNLSCFLK